MVYPENGDMFHNRPNTRYYGTLGWLAAREGIDDARYIHTLYHAEKSTNGGAHVLQAFGNFDNLRRHLVERFLQERKTRKNSYERKLCDYIIHFSNSRPLTSSSP